MELSRESFSTVDDDDVSPGSDVCDEPISLDLRLSRLPVLLVESVLSLPCNDNTPNQLKPLQYLRSTHSSYIVETLILSQC